MKRKTLIVVGILSLLVSCQNELPIDLAQPEITPIAEQQEEFVPSDEMIQLGRKLENPYSLENMRRALKQLPAESRSGFSAEDIQPTHLYVKFKPKNVDELDTMLWSDSTLHFYDYPLDYEQISGGCHYHDPSLPEGVPTYYYVSIPVGHPIPEVCEYEILEELYIPDELTDYTRTLSPAFINAIVKKSFELTGNEYECDAVATRSDGQTRASYTYSGTIRAWDNLIGDYVPVPGALIKCTYWFTTVTAVTNTNGYYTMTRESQNKYHYVLHWERDNKYDIRDGEILQAKTNGPTQTAGWSLDIGTGTPNNLSFATITRAAYRYFYGNTGGIDRQVPPSTGDLKICYKNQYKDGVQGDFFGAPTMELSGDIWIYGKTSETSYATTQLIYSTAVHEMGHANEYSVKTVASYHLTDDFIHESWAEFIQAYLTYIEYGELGKYSMTTTLFDDYCSVYQIGIERAWYWSSTFSSDYSSLFIDLYDDFNQRDVRNNNIYPNDNIVGYSPSTLNAIVNTSATLSNVRTNLKANKPTGVTDAMIDELIDFYNAYKPE